MRELLAAAVGLGWAASLYGAERLAAGAGSADELGDLAHLLRARLGPVAHAVCRAGDEIVRAGHDLRRGGLADRGPTVEADAGALVDVLAPGAAGALARQELRNRLAVYRRVVDGRERVDDGLGAGSTADVVDRIERGPAHDRLWAYEGLGYRLAARALVHDPSPHGLLRGLPRGAAGRGLPPFRMPEVARPMLHAGAGLAFAEAALADLGPSSSSAEARRALERFLDLCRQNAVPHEDVGAWDSLGFYLRHQRPEILEQVLDATGSSAPSLAGFVWHGIGRALYFLPLSFVPGFVAGSRALDRAAREAPAGEPRRQAAAGVAVAATLTNLRHPAVLETLVSRVDESTEDASAGFREGVESALLMRRLVPDPVAVERLLEHRPSHGRADAWSRLVRRPAERALLDDRSDEDRADSGPSIAVGPFLALNRRLVAERADA